MVFVLLCFVFLQCYAYFQYEINAGNYTALSKALLTEDFRDVAQLCGEWGVNKLPKETEHSMY